MFTLKLIQQNLKILLQPPLSPRYGGKALLQVGQNIVNMLRTDGQADGVGAYPLVQQLLGGELGVGSGGRMDYKGLHVRHISQEGENFQMVDEPVGLRLPALDLKGKDGAAAVRKIPLIKGMVRMVRQRGVVEGEFTCG